MSRLNEALQLVKKGSLEEARRILEDLAGDEPANPRVLYNLGMVYTRLGLMDQAIEVLEQHKTLASENVNSYTVLAFAYAHVENFEKAHELLERAVELDPKNFYAVKNLGAICAQRGDNEKAIKYFRQADVLKPENPEVLYGLALAYEQQRNLPEAVATYEKIQLLPDAGEVKQWATEALQRLKSGDGQAAAPRMDLVMYCLHAIRQFSGMDRKEVNVALKEIADVVETGIDEEDPDRRYTLKALEGNYTGMQLVCYLYVGMQRIGQEEDIGIDLSEEYEAAQRIRHQEVVGGK